MQDIWPQLRNWFVRRERFALATVVDASKPSPRGIGAVLAIHEDGESFIGSVSAGCVEHEVMEAAKLCLEDGKTRWLRFGPGSGFAWEVELSCGGSIKVRVDPAPHLKDSTSADFIEHLIGLLDEHRPFLWKSSLEGELISEELPGFLDTREIDEGGEYALYRIIGRRSRLVVVGASHIALHLVAAAKMLQYEVIVVDPREHYARQERFLVEPDRLIVDWPERVLGEFDLSARDALVAVTHDPKIDDQALASVLSTDCGYVGALGSKRSHSARLKRLSARGIASNALERIFGPVGLDVGSRTPAEIAISIVAQLIRERNKPKAR